MPLQSNLWFAAVPPASVPTPNPGYYALFISDGSGNTIAGFVHKKAANGEVTTAVNSPDDYTDEMARDAVASILTDSSTVGFVYDDAGNFISASVTAAAITDMHLAVNSVGTGQLKDGAVTGDKIIDGSITNSKIDDGAVTTMKIGDSAVSNVKLSDGSVTNTKLDSGAVTSSKLADNAVTNTKLADASITASKVDAGAITGSKLADATITGSKLVAGAVATGNLADTAVTTVKVADAAVTNAKLANMAAGTIKMRPAGTAGAPTDATLAAVKTALAIAAADIAGLGTAATQAATAFDAAGAATAAQAAAIAASQPLDADLTAIAALSTTAYGRALLTLSDAAANTAQLNVATTALKGLMAAADKTKLDALAVPTAKLRYVVTDYGITTSNTGAANVTAWNTLMTTIPDNSEVYFPPGPNPFPFASTLNIPTGKHLKIAGASNQKSMIQTTSATADIFAVHDWYNEFQGLKFTSSVTRTAGAAINSGNNVAISVYDCDFAGMWDGILYTGGNSAGNLAVVENCGFTGTLNRGITLDGTDANTIIDKVVMDGTLGQQVVGLELLQCGSVLVSNSDFIRAQNNLRFNPTSPQGVFSAYFVNTFFDTSSASSVLFTGTGNVQRVKFSNCWFSGSVTGCEFASTATTLPTAIDFINCDIFGNSSRGIWAHGVQDFNVTNSRIAGNTTAGIEVSASAGAVTKFNLANNSICPTAGFGANGTGILINAGTYGGYAVKNNDLRNNTTNNLTDSGTVATSDLKIINDNFGHIITGSIGNLSAPVTQSGTSAGALLTARVPGKAATVGQVFRFRLFGNATATGTVTFRVYVGSTGGLTDTVAFTSTTSGSLGANVRAGFEGLLTIRTAGASGTIQCEAIGFGGTALLPAVTAAVSTPTVNTLNPWFITLGVSGSLGSGFAAQQAVVEAL